MKNTKEIFKLIVGVASIGSFLDALRSRNETAKLREEMKSLELNVIKKYQQDASSAKAEEALKHIKGIIFDHNSSREREREAFKKYQELKNKISNEESPDNASITELEVVKQTWERAIAEEAIQYQRIQAMHDEIKNSMGDQAILPVNHLG